MQDASKPAGETWLPIPGYEGSYEVSDHGRVRSLDRVAVALDGRHISIWGREMALCPGGNTETAMRWCVTLYRNGHGSNHLVHQLVLTAFVGPRPPGMLGCHNDGDGLNNVLSNLRWDTPAANMADMIEHGTNRSIRQTHCLRGHLLAGPNVRIRDGHHRRCVACSRGDSRVRDYRKRHGVELDLQETADAYFAAMDMSRDTSPA